MVFRVGLTGGIGSGKTTVSKLFADLGVPVIDTDILARELVRAGQPVLRQIIACFGDTMLRADGELDRARLAETVFASKPQRQRLEAILHPAIRQRIDTLVTALPADTAYVLIVVPLLFESGFDTLVDRILLVHSDEETRIQRIRQRDPERSRQQIERIIRSQISPQQALQRADDALPNNGDTGQLKNAVTQLHHQYLARSG